MRLFVFILVVISSMVCIYPAFAKNAYVSSVEIQAEVQRSFGEILDLWRDGRHGELYDRTIAGGKGSKEQFTKKLSAASRKPACCWEKMQEVKVQVKNDNSATLRAKVGLEGTQGTEYVTRSFKLQKDDGIWCISQTDILSLAGEGKKGRASKKDTSP